MGDQTTSSTKSLLVIIGPPGSGKTPIVRELVASGFTGVADQHLMGTPLTNRDPIFVERFSHGGMSSGYVSPQFWAETAIPLLRARYRNTQL
jgi:ABC-type molybdenum transport system ATPase subunit/photorepair protein PhrA